MINTDNGNYYNTILCKIIHHSLLNFTSLVVTKRPCPLHLSTGARRGDQRGPERETNMDNFDDEEKIVHFKSKLHSAHSQQGHSLVSTLRIVQVSPELILIEKS